MADKDKKNSEPEKIGDSYPESMVEVGLDFSGVKPFEPLPEKDEVGGTKLYLCEVEDIRLGEGPKGKKASVTLNVIQPEEFQKRKLFREYSLLPQALPFLHEFILAAKPGTKLGEDYRFRPAEFIGDRVAVSVQNEPYEEQIRSRVKKVHPSDKFK